MSEGESESDKHARKQKALNTLKRQVREQRARLDPALLARIARDMGPDTGDASTPYDRAAAAKTVELFLSRHKNKADFTARLFSFMHKNAH